MGAVQGTIQKDIITGNNYVFMADGIALVITNIGSIEETVTKVELPDGSVASGGQTEPVEFTISVPMHHDLEYTYMELWYKASKGPLIPPSAYKTTSIVMKSASQAKQRSMTVLGSFVSGRSSPELDMEGGGSEFLQVEYTISADNIIHA